MQFPESLLLDVRTTLPAFTVEVQVLLGFWTDFSPPLSIVNREDPLSVAWGQGRVQSVSSRAFRQFITFYKVYLDLPTMNA